MGMDRKVVFPSAKMPAWNTVADHVAARDLPLQLRMIDGQLAFPDEQPPDDWRELRLGVPSGMVTVRREDDGVRLVIWGNADPALQQACNTLAEAWAELTK